eukprot:CAMPEP_0182443674 /NCGR_PEP_ID=MMETSP1172-20130603/2349_1 /TAXON_ID=708627 /ORGANISM="Timspurckia oligopyrenoides, Strain CCMP3278" /LENGTH=398 /DNA_ID=CAMNT_0024639027 /DNA_START=122 /DNA_END=1318 /DNA_ORIENTATION=+
MSLQQNELQVNNANTSCFSILDNIRQDLISMDPYVPILPYEVLAEKLGIPATEIVKLDANENPHGPSPKVYEALRKAEFLHIYPDPESTQLRNALSEYTNVPKEYLLTGTGADELIDLIFRAFITPGTGESVINFPPTFGMYKFDSDVNGAKCIDLYRNESDFGIPIDSLEEIFVMEKDELLKKFGIEKYPKIVFITSPNNPDGSTISDEVLKRMLKLPALVVLDEAYFEFCKDNRIGWIKEYENLIVLRTFSKWAALAGMRIGYGAFPLKLMEVLWKIKQPYNVGVAAQLAAVVSLEDRADLLYKVELMKVERTRFYKEMEMKFSQTLHPFPSESNYVLCKVIGGNQSALQIKNELAKRGILIRYYSSKGLQDCIRVSMGTPQQMDRFYDELADILT